LRRDSDGSKFLNFDARDAVPGATRAFVRRRRSGVNTEPASLAA
jgi:hypothetical protein